MAFPCTACGACCRRAGSFKGFPEPVRSDGACTHLDQENKCMIYATRPLICRVDELRSVLAEDIPLDEWYRINAKACDRMQEADQIDPKHRVTLTQQG